MIKESTIDILKMKFKQAIDKHGANHISFRIGHKDSYIILGSGRDEYPIFSLYGIEPYDIYDKEELASIAESFGVRHNLTF